jgi:RND family efflux transporter MFP subunit
VIKARLNTTRTNRNQIRERLKMLVVRSPITGQIITTDLDLGEWITPAKELYLISDFDRIQLRVGVPGKYVESLPEGAPVEVEVPEIGAKLKGKVRAVVRHVDTASGNFIVRVFVDNPANLPLSGLLAQASLPTGSAAKVKLVPRDAIVRRGDATTVVVVRDSVAQIVAVKVRGDVRDSVIVEAPNLKSDEPVVVRGNERLFPGMPVAIAPPPGAPTGGANGGQKPPGAPPDAKPAAAPDPKPSAAPPDAKPGAAAPGRAAPKSGSEPGAEAKAKPAQ